MFNENIACQEAAYIDCLYSTLGPQVKETQPNAYAWTQRNEFILWLGIKVKGKHIDLAVGAVDSVPNSQAKGL